MIAQSVRNTEVQGFEFALAADDTVTRHRSQYVQYQ